MDVLAARVALKFASYFRSGDIVLMGKYKNSRGKIVGFGVDKWGNPTVEIEPIPKGRKKNKVMGLFKVWRADVKENVLKKQQEEAARKTAHTNDQKLDLMAHLLASGASDRKIVQTMGIDMTEAHHLVQQLRELHGLTSMDNIRKTLKQRMAQ